MKTYNPKPKEIEQRWWLVDAEGQTLGRLASEVAQVLRGKHKPQFAPHLDVGDHVVVVNASKVRLSGAKHEDKVWYRHSQYPGGLRRIPYDRLLAERPDLAVEKAVKGMLPKNKLGRQMIKKLHVYAGEEHNHQGQRPEAWGLGTTPGAVTAKAAKPKAAAKAEEAAAEAEQPAGEEE